MNRLTRGRREYEALMGTRPEDTLAEVYRRSPQMWHATIEGAFGGSLANSELERAARELVTVAMIAAAGGADRQLTRHVAAALRNGVAAAELRALCEQVAVYAGFPRGLNALAAVDEVLTGAGVGPPPAMRRISLADHETVVARRGDTGPAVVLVHALGLDWRMWEQVMDRLATGRRLYAYDLRSHGFAAGSPTPFTMDKAARDLIGVLDEFGLDTAHIVGLSFGGGIVQTAAITHPERFASMALLAATDEPFEAFESRAHSGEVDGMEAQVVPSLTRWFTPPALAVNGWGVRYARELIRRAYPQDWAASWRAFKGLDVQDRLTDFPAPTLVMTGELDQSTTPKVMTAVAKRITGSSYRELPGTPHMQTLEQPDVVADALGAFLPAG